MCGIQHTAERHRIYPVNDPQQRKASQLFSFPSAWDPALTWEIPKKHLLQFRPAIRKVNQQMKISPSPYIFQVNKSLTTTEKSSGDVNTFLCPYSNLTYSHADNSQGTMLGAAQDRNWTGTDLAQISQARYSKLPV